MKTLLKNIEKELDLIFYKFDDMNNEFKPSCDFGSFLTKEYIAISVILIENDISFETKENSSIKVILN